MKETITSEGRGELESGAEVQNDIYITFVRGLPGVDMVSTTRILINITMARNSSNRVSIEYVMVWGRRLGHLICFSHTAI